MEFQLCKMADKLPKGDNWIFEMKYDGYRAMLEKKGNSLKLISRNGIDFSKKFQSIINAAANFFEGKNVVLDGEIVVVDEDGRSDFSALQAYFKSGKDATLLYIAFDLLEFDGKSFKQMPLLTRKEKLQEILTNAPKCLHFSNFVNSVGQEELDTLCQRGFEGIVAKQKDSLYSSMRNGDWLKIKCRKTDNFLIGGFELSKSQKNQLGSILVGKFVDNQLIFLGKVGTGFSQSDKTRLLTEFQKILAKKPPFQNFPKAKKPDESLFWVLPHMTAKVEFAELTKANLLRQASFVGLVQNAVTKDLPKNSKKDDDSKIFGVAISSPQRLVFKNPAVKKIDVAKYYEAVSNRMFPLVQNRLLSLVCCPKGATAECFFQKHIETERHGLLKIDTNDAKGFFVTEKSGLIFQAQMNTIEFHTWGSSVKNLNNPDIAVFDLDPDEGLPIDKIRQGTKNVKMVLNKLKLKSFLKTSGGKGFHIVVPFTNKIDWDSFRLFCKNIANVAENVWPDIFTSNLKKENRKGKIFVDWMRNGKGSTSVAPYSLRAKSGATVSMPIFWEELDKVFPDSFSIFDANIRLEMPDPWADFFDIQKVQKLDFFEFC